MVLEHPQQLDLHLYRNVGDFVEKQRAAGRLFELAGLALAAAAGEGAGGVAEQFRLDQRGRQRREVQADQRLAVARVAAVALAGLVDRACDELLAGAALAQDQHRHV